MILSVTGEASRLEAPVTQPYRTIRCSSNDTGKAGAFLHMGVSLRS